MLTNNYYFYISIPNEGHIEYLTKLNSFIHKYFPGRVNPYLIRPLEIKDNITVSKISIISTESEIVEFASRLFGNNYRLIRHDSGDIEIAIRDEKNISSDGNSYH